MCMCVQSLSRAPLCDPLDCSPLGSSVHGLLQARRLEWVATSSSDPASPALPECSLRLVAQLMKKPPAMRETWFRSLDWEDPMETGKAIHSSILA